MSHWKQFAAGAVAALAVLADAAPAFAQATAGQARPAPRRGRRSSFGGGRQKKPNILVIWGDDIGQFNISAYQPRHDGLQDAEHRPHRQRRRAVHRLVRPAELHGRPRRVRHRPVADPHRPHEGRPAGRAGRHEDGRPDDRHAAQGAGLRHRPVRQEPPRRPRRDAADERTASTSSSAISTTSTPRKSPRTRTIRRTPSSRRSSARAASSTASPAAASPTPAR